MAYRFFDELRLKYMFYGQSISCIIIILDVVIILHRPQFDI